MSKQENENKLKYRIMSILMAKVEIDLSLRDFIELTDVLKLDKSSLDIRNKFIEIVRKERKMKEINEEWDLLEMLEGGM